MVYLAKEGKNMFIKKMGITCGLGALLGLALTVSSVTLVKADDIDEGSMKVAQHQKAVQQFIIEENLKHAEPQYYEEKLTKENAYRKGFEHVNNITLDI